MNKLIAASIALLLPFASYAESNGSYAYITEVNPIYKDSYVTRYETVCKDVEIPVYGERTIRGSDGDVFAGAMIGGVIGNQFGGGNGKDVMTLLGALAGANKAKEKTVQEIVGFRISQECNNVTKSVNEPIIYKYRIRYTFDGNSYIQETTQKYTLGQRVLIQPSLK